MAQTSFLRDQYQKQSNLSVPNSDSLSPVHASIDPRFSSLFARATDYRDRMSHQKVNPANWLHSPSTITLNSNAWSPTETSNEKLAGTQKSCLSPEWKNRLQGLSVGLGVAAISTAIILSVLLTSKLSLNKKQ